MFTTVAFSESQNAGGAQVNMAAVTDQTVKTNGDFMTVPVMNNLIGAAALVGTSPDYARLVAPEIRKTNPVYINPVTAGLVPAAGMDDTYFPANPVSLFTNENMEFQYSGTPGGAEQASGVLWLSDGNIAPFSGQVYPIRATITTATTAGSWVFSEITLIDDLPIGDYRVVGARCEIAAGVAFRFVPVGYANRPGGLTSISTSARDPYAQRRGGLGEWFQFNTTQLPGVDLLSSTTAGSATYQMVIDVAV